MARYQEEGGNAGKSHGNRSSSRPTRRAPYTEEDTSSIQWAPWPEKDAPANNPRGQPGRQGGWWRWSDYEAGGKAKEEDTSSEEEHWHTSEWNEDNGWGKWSSHGQTTEWTQQ